MDSATLVQILVLVLAAGSVGSVAFVLVNPYLSGERALDKRRAGVARGRGTMRSARSSADELAARKKNVQDSLKELEKKQKAKNKLTMKMRLSRAGLDVTPQRFYIASAVTGAVFGIVAFVLGAQLPVVALIAFASGLGLPRWVLKFLAKRRQSKFVNEFANAIDVIVRGVKTGLPLNECLDIIARESPEPVRTEFAELVEMQRVGMPLMECFERMMERIPLAEVNFFAIVISIQQSAGGNLAEALGNLSGVLRARKMLAAKVKALSSEAKTSAVILAAMPFIVISMVYITAPEYISLLWTDPLGQKIMFGASIWMSIGLAVMRKMINFKY